VRKMADDSLLSDEAVALEAGFDFSGILDNLNDANGQVKAAPSREAELALVIKPRAFDISDPAHPVALDAPPAGRYSITVIESTGQTWRVPNELAPALAGPLPVACGGRPAGPERTRLRLRSRPKTLLG
jgi:hypothetical protein